MLLYNNDKASIIKDMNIVEIEQSHSRGKIVSQTFDRTPIEYSEFAFPNSATSSCPSSSGVNTLEAARVLWMCPHEQDPRWHQFPSALAASASCGTSFGLL